MAQGTTTALEYPRAHRLVEWKESLHPVSYSHGVVWMKQRVHDIRYNGAMEALWLLEHDAVYTYGPHTSDIHVQAAQRAGLKPLFTDRGGNMTYHGPGQTVIYGMIHLAQRQWSIREWLEVLMQWVTEALRELGVPVLPDNRHDIGLWTPLGKMASIGLRVSRGVTLYGLALNHWPQKHAFDVIAPCGQEGTVMTSLVDHGVDISRTDLWALLKRAFPLPLNQEEEGA